MKKIKNLEIFIKKTNKYLVLIKNLDTGHEELHAKFTTYHMANYAAEKLSYERGIKYNSNFLE